MAIKVRNNLAAIRSLGQLNINITELGKALTRVASGQKINSAADDASGLAISERMRVQIRALAQDVQNVKNGSSMLEIASGGVGNIVDVLREMKKLAIDAANDSNSDEDRRTIQKELKQRMLTINDVAIGTNYNGKRLIDGTYDARTYTEYDFLGWPGWPDNPDKTFTMVPGKTYTKTVYPDGSRIIKGVNTIQGMGDNFKPVSDSIAELSSPVANPQEPIQCEFGYDGSFSSWNWTENYARKPDVIFETEYFEDTKTKPSTPQQVIRAFMHSLDETRLLGNSALDEAIKYCTGGKFVDKSALVKQFMADLDAAGDYDTFLKDFCDIDLTNADTGAITGSDAGGGSTKTAESIVPESHAVSTWGDPTPGDTTKIAGVTIHWPTDGVINGTLGGLSDEEKFILRGLNSDWTQTCADLIEESFGLSFTEDGTSENFKDMYVVFEYNTTNGRLAAQGVHTNPVTHAVDGLSLIVNMNYYGNIDTTDENGNPRNGQGYLDRTLAHEFTHGLMRANINNFDTLPLFIIEGSAELVHGVDDARLAPILDFGKYVSQEVKDGNVTYFVDQDGNPLVDGERPISEVKQKFNDLFTNNIGSGEVPYAGGYIFLRYLAKQGQGQEISKLTADTYNETGVEINFNSSHDVSNSDSPMPTDPADIPAYFDNQGFSILCGGCAQYINIIFDADKNVGEADPLVTQGQRSDFVVGIKDITSQDDLARAIFEGIANASGRSTSKDVYVDHTDGTKELAVVSIDPNHNVRIAKNPAYPDTSENEFVFLKDCSPPLDFITSGIVEATGGKYSTDDIAPSDDIETLEDGTTIETITVEEDTPCGIFEAKVNTRTWTERTPLVIHDGTQAGQRNFFYIKNMQTKALTAGKIFDTDEDFLKSGATLLNESDRAHYEALSNDPAKQQEWIATLIAAENKSVDDITVTTVKDANIAIRVLDGALEYALDNATRLGAYLQRLETDEGNLTTSNENVTAAESTIRDADMAREMTSYTKANVLAQAAQAMLAQANQNSSAVLSLLQ